MKRATKPSVNTSPAPAATIVPKDLTPPSSAITEEALASNRRALQHLLEAKRQQFYADYRELCAVLNWSPAEELASSEKLLAEYCGAPHAFLFSTEGAALQTLLEALSISCHDRIYFSENLAYPLYATLTKTSATLQPIAVEPVSRRMDLNSLSAGLRKQATRGRDVILVSHPSGGVFPLGELEQLICDPATLIIEDATEALGAKELSGNFIGSSHHSTATLFSFSSGSLLDVGGGGGLTLRDAALEKKIRALCHGESQIGLAQTALVHAQLDHAASSIRDLLKRRQEALTSYLAALQEAFAGVSKDRQPQVAESLLDPHAAPSSLLLRIDCVQLGARKERIVYLFQKANFLADWGMPVPFKKGEKVSEEHRPSSCFTSLRLSLDLRSSQSELANLFREFRDLLMRS